MEGVLVVGRQNADIADTLQLRDVAMLTTFWVSMGYNFSSMIGSDTLFDWGGFSGTSYPNEGITEIEDLRPLSWQPFLPLH